jgi:hypothetical protein
LRYSRTIIEDNVTKKYTLRDVSVSFESTKDLKSDIGVRDKIITQLNAQPKHEHELKIHSISFQGISADQYIGTVADEFLKNIVAQIRTKVTDLVGKNVDLSFLCGQGASQILQQRIIELSNNNDYKKL